MSLHGSGFIVTPAQAEHLGLGKRLGLEKHIRLYRNGRDLTSRPRDVMVVDLFGLTAEQTKIQYPEVYQHLLVAVKPEREKQAEKSKTKDSETYAKLWWLFGKPRQALRPALDGLTRYIATVETAKHRVLQFLSIEILPDNMLVAIASDDAFHLGVCSSRFHTIWALKAGGWLGIGNDPRYSKSRCFDPFPFPDATEAQKQEIRRIAEELDAHRKRQLNAYPKLTLTGLYNVLEHLRSGASPSDLSPEHHVVFDDGLVMILYELHQRLDHAVAEAYGWPVDLTEQDVLARLVSLNRERRKEEARGEVRWLRPSYQSPRFGKELAAGEQLSAALEDTASARQVKPSFPTDDMGQTAAIIQLLMRQTSPLSVAEIAASFRQGKRIEAKATAVLDALARMAFIRHDGENYLLAALSEKLAA